MYRIGIDIGGTFTDLVLYNEDLKSTQIIKTPTTPESPFEGAQKGMSNLRVNLKSLSDFTHGTTIGTNAIIQKKGARVAMITTNGMRDILEADSGVRGILYDLKGRREEPLVKRSWRYEVNERVLVNGEIAHSLDTEELKETLYHIAKTDAEAVAICFLHSYVQDENERKAEELVKRILPNLFISISSKVSRYPREFERFSTTVLNSYIGPLMSPYIDSIHNLLREGGYDKPFWIMSAAGGAIGADIAQQSPVLTINSGPAAGVVASTYLAKLLGYENVICCDIGGTSADISLIRSYKPNIIRDVATKGYPNVSPQLDIVTIGSGGGTVAWVESVGAFRLGPHSMGASPGPACYGRGGNEATITDAVLLLGWINANHPLGGEVTLYPELARAAISRIANSLKVKDEYQMSEAIVKLAVTTMIGGIKVVSTGRGHDVRDFALMAFGGAGPMFAAQIASELGILKVLIPLRPGNFCAAGMLQSEVVHQYLRPVRMMTSETKVENLYSMFSELEEEGKKQLIEEGFVQENIHFEKRLAMRYPGQHYTLEIPLTTSIENLEKTFYKNHREVYQFAFSEPLMITDFIVNVFGSKPKAMMEKPLTKAKKPASMPSDRRPVWFGGRFIETPIYRRDNLPTGSHFRGPAIFEEMGSTTVLQPHWTARIDDIGTLILQWEE
jgi:N-methylhydantoinase A